MGVRGPLPKDPAKRARRNKPKPKTQLTGSGVDAPSLPDFYLPQTQAWWEATCDSPQSSQFLETDWQTALRCAALVDAFWREPSARLASEIRQLEAKLGATAADRARLGWEVPSAGPEVTRPAATERSRPDPRRVGA